MMKTQFKRMIKALCGLCVACSVWLLVLVRHWASRASCRLVASFVKRLEKEQLNSHQGFELMSGPENWKQKTFELLNAEPEPVVGVIRESVEKTRPGQVAIKHISQRHDYAVLNPNKQENIRRILNVFDAFPRGAYENAFRIIERSVKTYHHGGNNE